MSRIKAMIKRLPGIREAMEYRDALEASRDALIDDKRRMRRELSRLRTDRAHLRQSLAMARLSLDQWKPGYHTGASRRWGEFFETCVELGGVRPDSAVLDIGCGIGGLALEAAGFLNDEGRYEGIDVDPRAIAVCNGLVERPNFHFQEVDIRNQAYNPNGVVAPDRVTLPVDSGSFDLVMLRSVFTHMRPSSIDHYLSEIARTLKPGGRCVATWFLFDEEALQRIADPETKASRRFLFDRGNHRIDDERHPMAAVAYDDPTATRLYEDNGLRIVPPIHHGKWGGRSESDHHQDFIVAAKP